MYKKLIVIVVSIINSTIVFTQYKQDDCILMSCLKGEISTYKRDVYLASGDSASPKLNFLTSSTSLYFNRKGKLDLDSNNIFSGMPITNVGYNRKGKVSYLVSPFDSIVFDYGKHGLIKKQNYKANKTSYWEGWSYNSKGNITKYSFNSSKAQNCDSTTYEYLKNKLIRVNEFADGYINEFIEYSYHKNGNIAIKKHEKVLSELNSNDSIINRDIDSYNLKGEYTGTKNAITFISWKQKETEKPQYYSDSEYIEEVEISEIFYFPEGYIRKINETTYSKTCNYDELGNRAVLHRLHSSGAIMKSSYYKYDSHNNNIEELILSGGINKQVELVSKARITYF